MTAKLPSLDHFSFQDYDNFYEPSDDTFLVCDSLFKDRAYLDIRFREQSTLMCLEIGSGSGCVITYLKTMLNDMKKRSVCFGIVFYFILFC